MLKRAIIMSDVGRNSFRLVEKNSTVHYLPKVCLLFHAERTSVATIGRNLDMQFCMACAIGAGKCETLTERSTFTISRKENRNPIETIFFLTRYDIVFFWYKRISVPFFLGSASLQLFPLKSSFLLLTTQCRMFWFCIGFRDEEVFSFT